MSIESRSRQYGKVFDHWQIREYLGEGSGGKTAVFSLVHTASETFKSALKVVSLIEKKGNYNDLSPSRKQEYEQAKQFCKANAEREVLLMNELQESPYAVGYRDHTFVDWADGNSYGCDMLIRMELLQDLRTVIENEHRFTEEEILKIGIEVCSALVLCHQKEILHRDVKPENIFFNKEGIYKLGDFGISRILSAIPTSKASTNICTPEYAAPEQFSGNYDNRVDIYSLGMVLYELSNDRRLPFAASTYVTLDDVTMRINGTPIPRPKYASNGLADVILKACAHRPEDRYQNAESFLKALKALQGKPRTGRETREAGEDEISTVTSVDSDILKKRQKKDLETDKKRAFLPGLLIGFGLALVAVVVLIFSLALSGQGEEPCSHSWMDADCTNPRTCRLCGAVSGMAEGHQWTEANYNAPKTCITCGTESGTKKKPSSALSLRDMVSRLSASSVYSGDNLGIHDPKKLYDGRLDTNWTENASGSGIGEYVTFHFDGTYAVNKMQIYIGSHFNESVYRQNCRPSVLKLTFSDGTALRCQLEDSYSEQTFTFDRFYYTDSIQVEIEDVYTGTTYLDTVIAELDFTGYEP